MEHWLKLVLILVALLLIQAAFRVTSQVRESRESWQQTETALLAKGEKLTLDGLLPEPIPDHENFFADPLWQEMTDRVVKETKGMKHHVSRIPREKLTLEPLQKPLTAEQRAILEKKYPTFAPLDSKQSHIKITSKILQSMDKMSPADQAQGAALVSEILAQSKPLIDQIGTLASRPDGLFPLEYANGYHMEVTHIGYLLSIGQWLHSRARVALMSHETDAAHHDALLLIKLSQFLKREPILISTLVRGILLEMATQIIDSGIKTHQWNHAQLASFTSALADIDLSTQLIQALRIERITMLANSALLLKSSDDTAISNISGNSDGSLSWLPRQIHLHFRLGQDKAFFSTALQEWIETLEKTPLHELQHQKIRNSADDLGKTPEEKATHLFSALSLPSLYGPIPRLAQLQTNIKMTIIACELEEYRLSHSTYPDSLTDLPSEYSTTKTLRKKPKYTKTGNETFSLYSTGWNNSDEGGTRDNNRQKGDWVWPTKPR